MSHISGTPSHWRRLLMSPHAELIDPKYVRLSGEIADRAILDALRAAYPKAVIAHAYASTEAGVGFEVADGREGFPAALLDANGEVELRLRDGSLHVRSKRTATAYIGRDDLKLLDDEGFVDTDDMVEQKGDRCFFKGRRAGVINVGGLKVHPEEVEQVINEHSEVRMSRVSARRNPIMGDLIIAEVAPRKRRRGERKPARWRRKSSICAAPACRAIWFRSRFASCPRSTFSRAANWRVLMRNVIVTGASRGLGLAITRRLVAEGFRVIAVARRESDALRGEIDAAPPGALAFAPFDLGEIDALPGFVAALKKQHGAPYGLVNNAGLGTEGLLANMHNSQIEELLRINVTAPIILTKYVVRQMMAGGGGRVVNISSIIASTGYNGLSAYGASKAALIGFTKSLAREVGRLGITVNAVAPGFIATEMTAALQDDDRARIAARAALRRLAEPADVANAVSYLLADNARNITGTVLTVDAGATA